MHTKGPWKIGKACGAVVSESPIQGAVPGSDSVEFYGGHLVAESISECNKPIIAAAPDLYEFAEWVRKEYGALCPRIKLKADEVLKKAGEGS